MSDRIRLNLHLERELHDLLRHAAYVSRRTLSAVARAGITKYSRVVISDAALRLPAEGRGCWAFDVEFDDADGRRRYLQVPAEDPFTADGMPSEWGVGKVDGPGGVLSDLPAAEQIEFLARALVEMYGRMR